jgi:hypothetical protein
MQSEPHQEILAHGAETWNTWRRDNPGVSPRLRRARLSKADLRGADLSNADLAYADLRLANLEGANLAFADLKQAELDFAKLGQADLRASRLKGVSAEDADFSGANLTAANLEAARLCFANLSGSQLHRANLSGVNMCGADLSRAKVHGVRYDQDIAWDVLKQTRFKPSLIRRRLTDLILNTTMRVRGIDASRCVGSQVFKVFIQDQDYLEEYLDRKAQKPVIFLWWLLADCGRSLGRWAAWSGILAVIYALIYNLMGPGHFQTTNLDFSFPTLLYYSVVTFTTLGFGDILPITHLAAMTVVTEVLFGYVMLGGLVSIFANKLARRGG